MDSILSFILGVGAIQGFFLVILVFRNKSGNRRANVFLGILLSIFSLNILHSTINFDLLFGGVSSTFKISEPFILAFSPMLYFYIREITSPVLKFKPIDLLHLLPCLVYMFFLPTNPFPQNVINFLKTNELIISRGFLVFLIIQVLIYIFFIHKILFDHRKAVKNDFSSIEKVDLHWLGFFIILFLAACIGFVFIYVLLIHGYLNTNIAKIFGLILSVVVYALGYKGLTEHSIFFEKKSDQIKSEPIPVQKYEHSNLPKDEGNKLSNQIRMLMENEKPFLDPELTLSDLSELSGIQKNLLSQVINEFLGVNFYDFVNNYRVEEFKRLLKIPENNKYTFLALAFDSGFNSKPAFNTVFKKLTGLTPSEYKKSCIV